MNEKTKNENLGRKNLETFKSSEKTPVVVVLDNIRSLNNIGSVFRTADAFLIEKIVLCGVSGTPPNKEIEKTALGSTESVTWEYEKETLEAMKKLKNTGYKIVAVEQAGKKVWLNEFKRGEDKLALIFGNEVYGVSQEVIDISDCVIEIPQLGTKHSLNIAVSVGIVLWEVVKANNQ